MAATAHATPCKSRTCRVCTVDAETRSLLVRVDEDGMNAYYHVREIPADFGRGFRVAKHVLHEDGSSSIQDPYHVLIGRHPTCECKGHTYRHRCRHVSMLVALLDAGRLPWSAPEAE